MMCTNWCLDSLAYGTGCEQVLKTMVDMYEVCEVRSISTSWASCFETARVLCKLLESAGPVLHVSWPRSIIQQGSRGIAL